MTRTEKKSSTNVKDRLIEQYKKTIDELLEKIRQLEKKKKK